MDKNTAINIVEKFGAAVRTRFDPEMIVLYGSFAKGTYTASSDIDVAVIVDHIEGDFL